MYITILAREEQGRAEKDFSESSHLFFRTTRRRANVENEIKPTPVNLKS